MADTPSWLDPSENPGLVFVLAIAVVAVVLVGVFVFMGPEGEGAPEGPDTVMDIGDAPPNYRAGGELPLEVISIRHMAGENIPGEELRIEVYNASSDEEDDLVLRYHDGEQTGGSAQDVSIILKPGRGTGETTAGVTRWETIVGHSVTPEDRVIIVDEPEDRDFSTLATYRVVVTHVPSGEQVSEGTTGIA